MSDDPVVQILLEAYRRGREISTAKKVDNPPQANPVVLTAEPSAPTAQSTDGS